MMRLKKWFGAALALALTVGTATAADTLVAGKVKSVNADKKEFVLNDTAGKDITFTYSDDVVINRGGKEVATGLKADDQVAICYEPGTRTSKAHYILVKEGDTKDFHLMIGSFKSFDSEKKTFTYTDSDRKDWTLPLNDSKVRLNMLASKIEEIKVGDRTLSIVEQIGEVRTLKDLMVSNKSTS